MEELRQYLLRVVAVCFLTALAKGIVQHGTPRRALDLACGLVLILALLRPIMHPDFSVLSASIGKMISQTASADRESRAYHAELVGDVIKEKTEAYIWDKASEEGFSPSEISVEVSFGSTYPYASGVTIIGPYTDLQKKRVGDWIESALAIPEERQQWHWSKS